MKISKEEVEHVALLARMKISEEEKELFAQQLSTILSYIDQLQKIDTSNVPETHHVTGLKNIFRKDAIQECNISTRETILKNPPEKDGPLIKTKSVFE